MLINGSTCTIRAPRMNVAHGFDGRDVGTHKLRF